MQRRKKKKTKTLPSIEINIALIDTIKVPKMYPKLLLLLQDNLLLSACQKDVYPPINSILILYDPMNDYKHISQTPTKEIIFSICQVTNGNIVTNSNRYVCIWKITKEIMQCLYTIPQIKDDFNFYQRVFYLSDNRFGVSLDYGEIKIFKCDSPFTSVPIKVINEYETRVLGFKCISEQNILLTSANDETLRIWNMDNYQCISIIEDINCECFLPIEDDIVIAGGFRAVYIINIKKGTFENLFLGKICDLGEVTSIIKINKEEFLCNSGDCFVIFNIQTKAFVLLYHFHSNQITSLIRLTEHICISSSRDKTIKIWKY